MDRRIMETLSADIEVTFELRNNNHWEQTFNGTGRFAGLEVVGDVASLSL